jgi:hypothetical protein
MSVDSTGAQSSLSLKVAQVVKKLKNAVTQYRLHHQGEENHRARNVSSNYRLKHAPERRFLQQPHGVTSHKTTFFSHRRENLKSYIAKKLLPLKKNQ